MKRALEADAMVVGFHAQVDHLADIDQHGAIRRLDSTCTVIGMFEDWQCSLAESRIDPGDVLAIYTDGLTESPSAAGDEFGEQRLVEALAAHRCLPAKTATWSPM